jgi:hypothetical protein
MTVDMKRLPTLRLGDPGKAVTAAKMGVNRWDASKRNTTPLFGIFFLPLVKEFQKAFDIPQSGVIGPATWGALMRYIPPAGKAMLPKEPVVPKLGPITPGGQSILAHDLTHATDGIRLYPAFDDAFTMGQTIIAPEPITVQRPSHSNPGQAFYAIGESSVQYWFGHLDRSHAKGIHFRRGETTGHVAPNHIGGGPHCHCGINVEKLLGRGRQLIHHTNYTHGAPTVGEQLSDEL